MNGGNYCTNIKTNVIKEKHMMINITIMCSWVPLSILKYNKYNLLYERLFIINIIYYMNGYL